MRKKKTADDVVKNASMRPPGRGGTSHLTDFYETWPVSRFQSETAKSKVIHFLVLTGGS